MGSLKGVATLKGKREFDKIYRNSKVFHTPFFVLFYKEGPQKRVGFVASKKVGKAVKRNRAKRLLKALVIPYIMELKTGYYIFVAKPAILEAEFVKVEKIFFQTLKKARVI